MEYERGLMSTERRLISCKGRKKEEMLVPRGWFGGSVGFVRLPQSGVYGVLFRRRKQACV